VHCPRDPLPVEDILDLADRDHLAAALLHPVEDGRRERRKRIIPPVCSADIRAGIAGERAGDHSSDRMFARQHFARNAADVVEAFKSEEGLVRRNLEDRIR
jgi:hypothetical protein